MPRRRKLTTTTTSRRRKKKIKIEIKESSLKEIYAVFYAVLALICFLSIENNAGRFGESFKYSMEQAFGQGIWIFPISLAALSLSLFFSKKVRIHFTKLLGAALALSSSLGLMHLSTHFDKQLENVSNYGGWIGFTSSFLFREVFNDTVAGIILTGGLLIAIIIISEISLGTIIRLFNPKHLLKAISKINIVTTKDKINKKLKPIKLNLPNQKSIEKDSLDTSKLFKQKQIDKGVLKKPEETPPKVIKSDFNSEKKNDPPQMKQYTHWEFPQLKYLDSNKDKLQINEKELVKNAKVIKEKLLQFGIEVTMKDINVGPTVTQYTLKPHEGIKLNKITSLKNDLALSLASTSIRIEAPIPGKPLVGIETPNRDRMIVHLREILESDEYKNMKSNLRIPLGRNVSGKPIIGDLTSMPHLLIAGRTGAGKSVCMNSFLISLLYQNSPADLRLIMIDPKRVELMPYNGIPHLLTNVITDIDKSLSALRWCVSEMSRRYNILSDKHHRNIDEYNNHEENKLFKIVIIIDELADLMMRGSKKEAEVLICRIAQMARAVGLHLIIATQRPSVDVITGLIKANIPSRVAFAVASNVDSRTIIDSIGAEDLLGLGDMLYLPGGMDGLFRIQGILLTRKEITKVTNHLKVIAENTGSDDIILQEDNENRADIIPLDVSPTQITDFGDSKFFEALNVIIETGKASATLLQRRLEIGYARAAKILDLMESHGLIGEARGAKARGIHRDKIDEIMNQNQKMAA